MENALISVVILNYRRRSNLIRALESVREQSYAPREVIVVDNGSGDDLADFLAREFPEVRLIALPENIGCAGRNRGVAAARGEIVATIDNDVYFVRDVFTEGNVVPKIHIDSFTIMSRSLAEILGFAL